MIARNNVLLTLLISTLFIPSFPESEQPTIYKKVMQHNMASLAYEDDDFSSDRYGEYLEWVMNKQLKLQEFQKRRALFLLLDKRAQKNKAYQETALSDTTTWKDLTLFCGQSDLSRYVAASIDRTKTAIGKVTLYSMLAQPSSDIHVIQKHQHIIKALVDNPIVLKQLEDALARYADSENMFISTWTNDPFKQTMKRRYFNFSSERLNRLLNTSPTLLNITTLSEHYTRMMWTGTAVAATALLPVYAIAQLTGHKLPHHIEWGADKLRDANLVVSALAGITDNNYALSALSLAGGYIASQGIQDSYEWAKDNFVLDTYLHAKMMHIAQSVKAIKAIGTHIAHNAMLRDNLSSASALEDLFKRKKEECSDVAFLFDTLESDMLAHKPTLLSNRGKTLVAYKTFCDNKELFNDAIAAIGELDMYVSLARLYVDRCDSATPYCFANFSSGHNPLIALEDFWNPCLDPSKAVCNSLRMGTDDTRPNMIITGPNAGGKSTLLKAIGLAIIIGQSFGLVPARQATFTPFDSIMTYLNITDDLGAGNSLFKAQVKRAQHLVDTVNTLPKNKKSLVIIDEMFNGTSPKEAQACAFSVAQALGNNENGITIVATHYELLTKLEQESHRYSNYHVSVQYDNQGKLVYPFLLEKGVSHQHVALDILRDQGFDSSIAQQAQEIVKKTT